MAQTETCTPYTKKKPLLILTGPTASGKSALAITLAKAVGGQIISADSMQVYRGMDIGSAKITSEEMQGIPHHLIDILDPDEPFDVTTFQHCAKQAIDTIYAQGQIPILVGGTGFYIQAVLYDIDFTEESGDGLIRRQLEQEAETQEGRDGLFAQLQEVDPASAASIHPNNIRRVIRALEYYRQTGERISAHNETQHQKESPYDFRYFVLTDDRQILYDRIDRRVDQMVDSGLVEEVTALMAKGYDRTLVSMQGLGYKEIIAYLEGECSLEEAVYIIKRDTRHFAKRQLTWFRREKDVIWLDRQTEDVEAHLLAEASALLQLKGVNH